MFGHVPEVSSTTILVDQKYVSKQTVTAFTTHVPLPITSHFAANKSKIAKIFCDFVGHSFQMTIN